VLARLNENLDWMQDLGDAFLGQQAELMDAVQRMRHKAKEAGTLESGKEQTVSEGEGDTIVIQPADPEVIYVPTYYPSSCYGSWGYPTWYYPPMYAPPPAGGLWFGFSVGVIWGSAWGDCDWGNDEINIDIDNENNFIDRTERPEQREKVKERASTRDSAGNRGKWQHDASHRKGVGYRDPATSQRFGDRAAQQPHVSRDQARGYGDRSATRPSTGGPAASRDGARAGTSDRAGTADRSGSRGSSSGARTSERASGGTTRPSTGERSSSFSGSRNSGMERAGSSRGAQSRGSAGSRGGGGRGGGGRGGRR